MAASNQGPFQVDDFSLGLTDNPFESDPRYSIELDNYTIEPDGKLRSRYGSVVDDTTNPQIPAGVKRISSLINYDNSTNLLVQSEKKVYYRNPSAFATLTGPTANDVFSAWADANAVNFSQWNKQVFITHDAFPRPTKIYKDSGGVFRVNTSGMPALATSPTATPTAAGANAYAYAFHYDYQYTVGSQTFEDPGPVTLVQVVNSAAPNVNQINIAAIPTLANGATDNWATAAITVFIYRTVAGGTTFYKIGQVTNGTAVFVDNFADATIQTGLVLYTDDGTLDYDPTPLHKFVHVVNNTGYYGFIKEGSVEYPFRLRQSTPGNPSACPTIFELDVEDEITGIGSVASVPIVFCKRHVYRLDGSFDQFGRGGITPIRISDTAGCVSALSIVSAEGSIFWAGNDGFYMSDGFNVQKISDKLNSRYKAMLTASAYTKKIYGKFDEINRRVYWAVQSNSSSLDIDSLLILELRWGISAHCTFTTWSGTSFRPTCLEMFSSKLYRGDTRGYIMYHDTSILTDPRVDTTAAASTWQLETIIWNYKSLNYSLGDTQFRKRATRILLSARNIANTSIQINAINDDGKSTRSMKMVRWRRNFIWGDSGFVWGNEECIWNSIGIIEQWRRFPARPLRFSCVQIQITNAYSVVINSDLIGNATFANAANTVTLVSSTNSWPTDSVDYYISTEIDGYAKEFKVLTRTSDTVLTVIDSTNTLPNGSYKWVLRGYRKGEPINIISYNIFWEPISQTQFTYESGDDGTNA